MAMLNSVLSTRTPSQGTRDHLMAVLPRTKVCATFLPKHLEVGLPSSFCSTIQCVVTIIIIAFMAEVVGMSVGSGFPVLSSRGWLVK